MSEKERLKTKPTADYIGCSVSTLRRLIKKKVLHPFKLNDSPQGHLYFDKKELDEYLDSLKQKQG